MFKFKILLIVNAVGAGVLGFLAICFPAFFLSTIGLECDCDQLARIVGVQLLALMMVMWFLIWSESKPLLRSMSLALFIYNLLAVIVSFYHLSQTQVRVIDVGFLLIHFILTLAYGFFSFKGRRSDIPTVCD